MNKLLTKIVGVALGATMAVGVGVAAVKASDGGIQRANAAESAVAGINFKTGSKTSAEVSTAISSSTNITTIGTQTTASYFGTKVTDASNSYYNSNGGLGGIRVGKSSAGGSIKFTLATAITNASKVVVKSYQVASGKSNKLSVAESSTAAVTPDEASATEYAFDLSSNASLSTITIKSTSQLWVNSFTLYIDDGGVDPDPGDWTDTYSLDGETRLIKSNANVYIPSNIGTSGRAGQTSNQADAAQFEFTLVGNDTFTLKLKNGTNAGQYFTAGGTTGGSSSVFVQASSSNWEVETDGSSNIHLKSNGGKYLASYSTTDWRMYANTGSGNPNITFEYYNPSQTYTVSFNGNGGTGNMDSVSDVSGSYTLPDNGFTAPSGKTFAGWKADNAGELLAAGSNYNVVADVTFFAQWADSYTVTYSAGSNGTGSFADSNKPAGSYALLSFASLSGVSANSGYKFKNYTIGGVDKNPGETITLSSNETVTVNFEEITPEIEIVYSSYSSNLPASGYATVTWTAGGISGEINSIKNSNSQMQLAKSGASFVYNTIAVPGYITGITVSKASGTDRELTAWVDDDVISSNPAEGGTAKSSDWSWTYSSSNHYTHFRLANTGTGAFYASSIVIQYEEVPLVDPTGITIDNTTAISMDTYGYGKRNLSATVEPFNANDKTVTWGTNDSSVVTISDGVLTPVAAGSTTVYAHTANYDPLNPNPDLIETVSVTVTTATYKKATFSPTSVSAVAQSEDYLPGGTATLSTTGSYNTEKTLPAIQIVAAKQAVFTISGYDGMTILGFDFVMSSNASAGTGSLSVTAGETTVLTIESAPFDNASWYGSFSATPVGFYKDSTDYTVGTGENIVLTFGGVVNSLYVHSVSIRYIDSESSELETWCQDFLNNYTCDATGNTAPSTSDWDDFGLDFLSLSSELQLEARNADANESGNVIERAMAKYDYIMSKYGELEDEHSVKLYDNFIQRTVHPLGTNKIITKTVNNTVAIVVVVTISLVSVSALGAYFLLRKKKEER